MQTIQPTSDHPLPFDLTDEQPKTHSDAVAAAVNTVELINQLGGGLNFKDEDLAKAQTLVLGTEKSNEPKHVSSASAAAAAHRIVKEYDFQVFADAMQARNFITNKLVLIADCGDTKLELKALELLGKHSDIGLFTDRSEITITHTSSSALENSIKERIKRLLNSDVTDVPSMVSELDKLAEKKQAKNSREESQKEEKPVENVEDVEEIAEKTPEKGPEEEEKGPVDE